MDYYSDDVLPGTDVEIFEINYDTKRRKRMALIVNTPIGMKKVRHSQLSSDARHLFVHDMLRQERWIAISSIQQHDGIIYTVTMKGTAIALKPSVFLEE